MADRIAVLDKGTIIQIGTPHDIYDLPVTTFVAQLVGSPRINMMSAARENGAIHVLDSPIQLPIEHMTGTLPESFTLGVRPEDIHPQDDGPFAGQVALIEPLGVETLVHIKSGRQTLVSTVPGMTRLQLGDDLRFAIVRERLHFFDPDGRRVSLQ